MSQHNAELSRLSRRGFDAICGVAEDTRNEQLSIKVPAMGESVTEADGFSKWFKKVGDTVARDEAAGRAGNRQGDGRSALTVRRDNRIHHGSGRRAVQVGTVLGSTRRRRLGKVCSGVSAQARAATGSCACAAARTARSCACSTGPRNRAAAVDTRHAVRTAYFGRDRRQPRLLNGSGKDGRVLKGDILAALEARAAEWAAKPAPVGLGPRANAAREELRDDVASARSSRCVSANGITAQLNTFNEVDMSTMMLVQRIQRELREEARASGSRAFQEGLYRRAERTQRQRRDRRRRHHLQELLRHRRRCFE